MTVSWVYTCVELLKWYTLYMLGLFCINYTSIKKKTKKILVGLGILQKIINYDRAIWQLFTEFLPCAWHWQDKRTEGGLTPNNWVPPGASTAPLRSRHRSSGWLSGKQVLTSAVSLTQITSTCMIYYHVLWWRLHPHWHCVCACSYNQHIENSSRKDQNILLLSPLRRNFKKTKRK